jgi:hypothetical protein
LKTTASTLALVLALLFSAAAGSQEFSLGNANPYHREAQFTEIPPPAGTQAPVITIHTPQNGSFYPKNLTLTFDVTIPQTNGDKSLDAIVELYYRTRWEPTEIAIPQEGIGDSASFSIDLSELRGGSQSITITVVGYGSYETSQDFDEESFTMTSHYETFKLASSSTVVFTKDVVTPRISVLSPQDNVTYVTSEVELYFSVNEAVSQILYCLDGKENQSITGSTILTGLSEGAHNVTLFAADLAGNIAASKTVFFNVDLPESFPVAPATIGIASMAMTAAGLLVYFKKRQRNKGA